MLIAKVQLLRRRGILISPQGGELRPWSDEGYLETRDQYVGTQRSRRLVLRDLRSNPQLGIMFELFRPTLVSIDGDLLRMSGLEPLDTPEGRAAVVQEWMVQLRRYAPLTG
jgi:hypothetical protein